MITGAWNDVKTFILRGGQLWSPIKTDVLKNFTAYTGKHLCSSFFLIKAYSFLYLWNFLENLFWRASAWDCYCIFNFLMISFEKFTYHPVTNMLLWVSEKAANGFKWLMIYFRHNPLVRTPKHSWRSSSTFSRFESYIPGQYEMV